LLFEFQGVAGEEAHRLQGAGVFFAEGFGAGDGERVFLPRGLLDFGDQGGLVRWLQKFSMCPIACPTAVSSRVPFVFSPFVFSPLFFLRN